LIISVLKILARVWRSIHHIETKPKMIIMKTLKIKLASLSLTLFLISFSLTAISAGSSTPNGTESNYFKEYFSNEQMNLLLDTQLKPELNVKIFNSKNQLIITGNETEDKVKSFIQVADLLTEIDGTKYYRLSY
jgi:hypothetical protein